MILTCRISDTDVRIIGLFTIYWNLFECLFNNCCANYKSINSLNLEGLDFEDKPMMFRNELSDYIMKKELLSSVSDINEEHVKKYLFTKVAKQSSCINDAYMFLKGNDDIHRCLICIYRIRNNLLHGEKDIWKISEQYKLLSSAVNILLVFHKWVTT